MSGAGCCLPGPSSSRPSRDTCFLCLQQVGMELDENGKKWQEIEMNFIIFTEIQVPARQWDAHRRQCALDNRDKLEHLSSPSPGMAAFPHYISSMCHSNTSPHTTYIVRYIKMSILKIQFAASVATPSSAPCQFIQSQVRKSQM